MSGTDGGEPGRREVAHRLLAAEFDDATLSYSESDEERAPNYVITPTGARVNRLFAVGVLTEVERVNDDVLRGRVVDPSGAFVTYAGQYQPDPAAFLDRTTPPAFVALTGKARTFEPEDSDVVYTSVRPESINAVDDDTRDRWVVSAAESTLERLAVVEAALESSARGDALRDRLLAAGVSESLAVGVPLAIDHYGTTPAYVEAVRRLAVDALELVAGERDAVRSLDVAPDAQDAVDVGPLPAVDLDLESAAVEPGAAETAESAGTTEETASAGATDATETADATGATESADAADAPDVTASPDAESDSTATETSTADETTADTSPDETTADRPVGTSTSSEGAETGSASGETDAGSGDPDVGETSETTDETTDETTEPAGEASAPADAASATSDADGERDSLDDLGDFDAGGDEEPAGGGASDDDLGDFDGGDASGGAFDEDEMYELDESERAELEAEFDTGFTSGNEVDAPGEADIDVPGPADEETDAADAPAADESEDAADPAVAEAESSGSSATRADSAESAESAESPGSAETEPTDESQPEPDAVDSSPEAAESAGSTAEPAGAPESAPADQAATDADRMSEDDDETAADADRTSEDDDETAADAERATEDVDLEAAVVESMAELDDGDGASREDVVADVVDEYGADPGAVRDAIQSALMSGRCYEPSEDSLKAI